VLLLGLEILVAADLIRTIAVDSARERWVSSDRCPSSTVRWWRLSDRLSEPVIQELLGDRRDGATQRQLAERYGISLSSVKRVLRWKGAHPSRSHHEE